MKIIVFALLMVSAYAFAQNLTRQDLTPAAYKVSTGVVNAIFEGYKLDKYNYHISSEMFTLEISESGFVVDTKGYIMLTDIYEIEPVGNSALIKCQPGNKCVHIEGIRIGSKPRWKNHEQWELKLKNNAKFETLQRSLLNASSQAKNISRD